LAFSDIPNIFICVIEITKLRTPESRLLFVDWYAPWKFVSHVDNPVLQTL
jgi:hypothetical protein